MSFKYEILAKDVDSLYILNIPHTYNLTVYQNIALSSTWWAVLDKLV